MFHYFAPEISCPGITSVFEPFSCNIYMISSVFVSAPLSPQLPALRTRKPVSGLSSEGRQGLRWSRHYPRESPPAWPLPECGRGLCMFPAHSRVVASLPGSVVGSAQARGHIRAHRAGGRWRSKKVLAVASRSAETDPSPAKPSDETSSDDTGTVPPRGRSTAPPWPRSETETARACHCRAADRPTLPRLKAERQ